jgi:hypothetical protein
LDQAVYQSEGLWRGHIFLRASQGVQALGGKKSEAFTLTFTTEKLHRPNEMQPAPRFRRQPPAAGLQLRIAAQVSQEKHPERGEPLSRICCGDGRAFEIIDVERREDGIEPFPIEIVWIGEGHHAKKTVVSPLLTLRYSTFLSSRGRILHKVRSRTEYGSKMELIYCPKKRIIIQGARTNL